MKKINSDRLIDSNEIIKNQNSIKNDIEISKNQKFFKKMNRIFDEKLLTNKKIDKLVQTNEGEDIIFCEKCKKFFSDDEITFHIKVKIYLLFYNDLF